MRTGEQADSQHVYIFLDGRKRHFFRGSVQAQIDHIHPGITQGAGHDLDSAIMAIQPDLGDQDANVFFLYSHHDYDVGTAPGEEQPIRGFFREWRLVVNTAPGLYIQLTSSRERDLMAGSSAGVLIKEASSEKEDRATMKVLVERSGPVTTVVINRPELRNAVDAETASQLLAAFEEFEADDEAAVAVLAGAGGCFCAGWDLKSMAIDGLPDTYDPEGESALRVSRSLPSKPVIAAVDGYCVAGGLELALWCDLRVAEADAVFGVFCRRWGVPLIDGGTIRLPRLIGGSRALDMILTGRPVGAEEALSFGLANRVVPVGQARAEAESLAQEIARFPRACMLADRLSCHRQWGMDLAEALRFEGRNGDRPLREEARRGSARFAKGLGRKGSFESI